MALAWKQVEAKPEFQALGPQQKQAAQEEYFNEVVAPKAGANANEARQQFFAQYNYQHQAAPSGSGAQATPPQPDQQQPQQAQQVQQKSLLDMSPLEIAEGVGETAAQMVTGTAADVYGGLKGGYQALTGDLAGGAQSIKEAERDYTYQPRTDAGKAIGRGIGKAVGTVMDPVQHAADRAADHVLKITGSPEAAAIVQSIPQSALILSPEAMSAKGLLRGGRTAEETTATTAAREASEAQAPTVAQDVPEDAPQQIAEAAKLSEKKQAKKPEVVASRFDPDKDRVDAAKRLGIVDELLPSTLSKNKQAIEIERGLASMPGSRLSESSKRETEAVAQKADDLISEFGGTTDKAALSDKLKSSIDDSIKGLDNKSEQLYSKINESIPKTSKVDTSDIKSRLNEEAENMGGADNLEPIEKHVLSIANKEGGPTYALLDKERKKIGTAMRKSQGPYKDANSGTLKQLYAMITEAQEKTAAEHGMADSWSAAKGLVVKRKQLEDNSVKLLGKNLTGAIMPQVGKAVKNLSTGDYKKFDEVMSALPKSERQEVVMSSLNDAFTGGSRKEKQLSAPGFVDWMEGLKRNSAAKNRLYKNMPDGAAERLEDIYKVAKGMREATAETIKTGRSKTLIDNFDAKDGILSRLFGIGLKLGGSAVTGHFFGPLAGAAAAGGSIMTEMLAKSPKIPLHEAADKMLSSPEFRKAIVDYSGATSETKRAAIERTMAKKQVVRNWLKQMSKASLKAGTSDEAKRISKIGAINYLTQTGNQE